MDFAYMTFQGRLTDDPEARTSGEGKNFTKFRVACNRRINKDEEKTAFIPVTVFGREAELCAQYLSKGREVLVNGYFETDKYTDGDGNPRTGFGVVAEKVIFGHGGSKKEDGEDDFSPAAKKMSVPTIIDSFSPDKKASFSRAIKGRKGR